MKHTLDDIPALVKSAWSAAVENDQLQFLSSDPNEIADDMLSADAYIEALQDEHDHSVLQPLIATEVRKLQNDL